MFGLEVRVRGSVSIAGTEQTKRFRLGRAYRSGRLICGWVQVTISDDERLGLTQQERVSYGCASTSRSTTAYVPS